MELIIIIAAFCLSLSFMLASCVFDQEQLQKSLPQVNHAQFTIPSLPRKFRLKEDQVNIATDKNCLPRVKPMDSSSGNRLQPKEEKLMHAAKGTWREWVQRANKSEYFTMDYSWVRRRRPIHNKQVPFDP